MKMRMQGWAHRSLNDLGKFTGGGTPSKNNSKYWNGDVLWITPKDMKSREIRDSEMKITSAGVAGSSAKLLPPNSVLIVARSGILRHTLPVCINRIEATVNQDIKAFLPGGDVIPEYVQYLLEGHESYILRDLVKGGVTVESLKYKEFQNQKFPVPPLDEQKRIVAKLDALFTRIDTAITHLQETLDLSKALFSSALDDEFRHKLDKSNVLPFGKVVINHDGKRIPIKASERKKSHGSYPYYGATGIIDYVDDYIFEGERLLISEDGANLVARKYPIAFLAAGKYWVNNHAHIVEAIPEITTNHYLELFLAWFDLNGYITGAAQPKLSQKKLNTIPVPVPSLDKQQRIVTHLDALAERTRTLEAETQERLDQLSTLKSSLLDAAFRGQL